VQLCEPLELGHLVYTGTLSAWDQRTVALAVDGTSNTDFSGGPGANHPSRHLVSCEWMPLPEWDESRRLIGLWIAESQLRASAVQSPGFVLFVEDDDDLRETFVELITVTLERRCVGVGSYQEVVALGSGVLACSAAILDINLGHGQPSGIDAYQWLRHKGYTERIVFLTGHASSHPLVIEATRIGDAEIFSKPIDPDRIPSMIEGGRQ